MSRPSHPDKHQARIRRMFGQIAPCYDFLNHLLSLNVDRSWRRRATRLVPPGPEGPILDLCTGTGDLALAYDRAGRGRIPIVGADFCHEMLMRAVTKAERSGTAGHIHFVEADAQDLPFPDNTFQIVAVAFGLRNVSDTARVLSEMVRVARPGGRIAILEFSRPRGRVSGPLYHCYFQAVLPRVGQVLSRSPESAYRYLPESVMSFPDGVELCQHLVRSGLVDVRQYPMTFGIATLYVGVKPTRPQ